jgi:hypothetical protein
VQLEEAADLDEVVADVLADQVKITGTMDGAIDAFTAPLDADTVSDPRRSAPRTEVDCTQRGPRSPCSPTHNGRVGANCVDGGLSAHSSPWEQTA